MGVWLWCCQVPLPLRVLIKTDTHQGRESTDDSAKGVKQRVLAKGIKKKKANKKAHVGNSAAKAVNKCCPASSLDSVCSALLPCVSSSLPLVPASPGCAGSDMPIRGLLKTDGFANNNFDF